MVNIFIYYFYHFSIWEMLLVRMANCLLLLLHAIHSLEHHIF